MLKIRRKKLMNTKKQSVYLIALFFVAVFMGVGYSYLNSTLSVNGYTTVYKSNWNVHFENVEVKEGSKSNATYSSPNNSTVINYQVPLLEPGEYYEFTVDVVNSGSIDAMIGSVLNSGITSAQSTYLEYSATYTSDRKVEEKDLLPAGSREKIEVKVKCIGDLSASSIPTEDQTINLSFSVTYIEAHNQIEVKHPVCKRAKTLHKSPCGSRNAGYNCRGDGYNISQDITYGSLGTSGTLAPGDAFDCDVNGDKKYNPETERFYYTTDLDTNNNYAVLLYSYNVNNGEPVGRGGSACTYYDSNNNPRVNGPVTAKAQLPTTSQWKNVRLYNTTRKLKDEVGNEYINIDYSGYAARLFTIQELLSACNKTYAQVATNSTDSNKGVLAQNCLYVLEGGQYETADGKVPTFETVNSVDSTKVFYISGWTRTISTAAANNNWYGVRPAIEVPKDKINY